MTRQPPNPDLFAAACAAHVRGDAAAAEALCLDGLAALDHEPPGPPVDLLRVRLLGVLVLATELSWRDDRGPADEGGNAVDGRFAGRVAAAERAAEASGEPAAVAVAAHLAAWRAVVTVGLTTGIGAFERARELARLAGDRSIEFAVLMDLGHVSVGWGVERGLALLGECGRLADGATGLYAPLLPLLHTRLDVLSGVAGFDDGNFDHGEALLRRGLDKAGAAGHTAIAEQATNFLAQLLTATGRFEEAEHELTAAVDRLSTGAADSSQAGYDLASLGKLYLEWERPGDAEKPIRDGWALLSASWQAGLICLGRNFLCDLLLHPSYRDRDPARAAVLLAETIEECRATGYVRSEVHALTRLAEVALERGDPAGARRHCARAGEILDTTGTLPSLRTEEVALRRGVVLRQLGDDVEAERLFRHAREVLAAKAGSLSTPVHRAAFLERVPVSREILAQSRVG